MNRSLMREFYCYIYNKSKEYYYSYYDYYGNVVVDSKSITDAIPLDMNPSNLKEMQLSFGTNNNYFSGVRSVLMNWSMVGDGADILRYIKYNKKGYAEELYFLIVRYDGNDGLYKKYYEGKFDLAQAKDTVTGYKVPCIDFSVWGILSQNDDVDYSIDCTQKAKNAVPILFDGITLKSKYTYQPVVVEFVMPVNAPLQSRAFSIVLVNTDGDSSGIIAKNQNDQANIEDIDNSIYKTTKDNSVHIYGEVKFFFKKSTPEQVTLHLIPYSNLGVSYFPLSTINFVSETSYLTTYTMSFDVTLPLKNGESITIKMLADNILTIEDYHFNFQSSNIYFDSITKADASIVYGRRMTDVLKEVVGKATNNQYTANSNYYSTNKNKVLTCGNSLRNSNQSFIKTSFRNLIKAYDIEDWIAFRVINNQLWVEKVVTIYDDSTNLFDIGEITKTEVQDTYDYLCNEIEANMNKQNYQHSSGRLEFNGLNTFSIHQYNIKNKISLISPYRKDCYGMEFIRLDYQFQSTEDNVGDDSVFMVEISDQMGTAKKEVYNFESVDINNQPLSPIIYFPYNNDIITNSNPVIRGVCQPNRSFNIYVDGTLDGFATSDANGNFNYNIQTVLAPFEQDVNDGVHTIEISFSDLTGTLSAVTITITTDTISPSFENIHDGDDMYDNKPLIRGYLQTGISLPLQIDGITVATVTGDGNCRWSYKSAVLSNASHVITLGSATATINVFSFVELPIITSFKDGFQIVNNLPLIEGVAKPGIVVNLYLDYYADKVIGTATADANGNWSYQLAPLFKPDGVTVLTPIPNGNHIISTSLRISSIFINIRGYLLNRPNYESISGVLDNSVFNTQLTPMHNLKSRMRYWKSIFVQQPDAIIKFETGDKNVSLSTTLNGITTKENDNIILSDYNDSPLFLPYILNFTCETPFYFAEIIDNFRQGGLIKMSYQGLDLYCVPIGKMSCEDVTNNVQQWSLLVSAKTPLSTLLKLSTPGLNIQIMPDTIFRSDYNTLHFVKYNYDAPIEFDEQPELYDDWFNNRNNPWVNNPEYLQKVQNSDIIIDQIIYSGVNGTITLRMYRCEDGKLVNIYPYEDLDPAPIPNNSVVSQATVNFSDVEEGEYFFAIHVAGIAMAVSERIVVAERHYGTILIDAGSKKNKPAAIFSNGWRSKIRVEGLVEKWIGNIDTLINEDEIGNSDNLHSISTRKRTILFGSGKGIPDYLYLKIVNAIILDDLFIQGVGYTISKNASVEPVDKIEGYPMYYYSVDFDLKENINGYDFSVRKVDKNVLLVDDNNYLDIGLNKTPNLLLIN